MESGLSFLWGKAEDHRIPKWQSWKRLDTELTSPLSLEIMTVCIKFAVWWYSLCPERRTPHFVNYPDLCSKLLRNRKFQNCRLVQTKPRLPRISKDLASGQVPHLQLWIPGDMYCTWRSHGPNHFQHECTEYSKLQRSLEHGEGNPRFLTLHTESFEW